MPTTAESVSKERKIERDAPKSSTSAQRRPIYSTNARNLGSRSDSCSAEQKKCNKAKWTRSFVVYGNYQSPNHQYVGCTFMNTVALDRVRKLERIHHCKLNQPAS